MVQFTDSSTPSGVADVWDWSFGTGDTSAVQNPVYTFTLAGQFSVTLNVTDTDNSETDALTRTNYITVTSGSVVTTSRVITYTYDGLYRLTEADLRWPKMDIRSISLSNNPVLR